VGEGPGPIEGIDAVGFFVAKQPCLPPIVIVAADERVAALDVAAQIGQDALGEERKLAGVLHHLEEQRQLGHFHGLRVDVDPVDVIEEDLLLLLHRQLPAVARLHHRRVLAAGVFGGFVGRVPVRVPVEQKLVSPQEEGARPAGRIDDAQGAFLLLQWAASGQQRADGVLDDVTHDIGGGVIDAAGLAHFGFFFHLRLVPVGEADDLAQKALVHLAEDVGGDVAEGVGAQRVVEVGEDVLEDFVVDLEGRGERVGGAGLALLGAKMKQARVVLAVGLAEQRQQVAVDIDAVGGVAQRVFGLHAAVFADAQEDDAVDGGLDGEVDGARIEAGVAQSDIPRQFLAPALHFGQKVVVHVGGSFFGPRRFDKLVEAAFHDGLAGEDSGDVVPFVGELLVGIQAHAVDGGGVAVFGFEAAVVNGQLLEIGEHRHGHLGGPAVAPGLKSRVQAGFDVDGGLLGFNEEDGFLAHAEGIVGGFGGPVDLDGGFVDHLAVFLRVPRPVRHVPAEGLEEGVEEVAAKLGFVVFAGFVGGALVGEALDEIEDDLRRGHGVVPFRESNAV